jgi:hypothetical protein
MRFETETAWLTPHIATLVIAGWTGRDAAGVQHHIDELQAIGIPAPSDTPLYYRVGANLLTQSQHIQVLGSDSSGEVEPLVLHDNGTLWLGLGSDHTDRKLEAVSVAASKQVCPKPVGGALWAFDSVVDHLDELVLSSEIFEDGAWVSYQSGHLSAIRPLDELITEAGLQDGQAMMCGTLPAIGGVRPAARFRASLHDPHTKQTLSLDYTTTALPIVA